jgi:hypothetical protein
MTDRQIVDKVKDALHGDDHNDVRIASGHDVSPPKLIEEQTLYVQPVRPQPHWPIIHPKWSRSSGDRLKRPRYSRLRTYLRRNRWRWYFPE